MRKPKSIIYLSIVNSSDLDYPSWSNNLRINKVILGLIKLSHALAKNSSSSGYLDMGGLHVLSFGT